MAWRVIIKHYHTIYGVFSILRYWLTTSTNMICNFGPIAGELCPSSGNVRFNMIQPVDDWGSVVHTTINLHKPTMTGDAFYIFLQPSQIPIIFYMVTWDLGDV